MDDWFPSADFLNGLSVVGTWTLIGLALISGKGLALAREVKQRDATIEWQRLAIAEKDATILELSKGTSVSAQALDRAVSVAAEGGS